MFFILVCIFFSYLNFLLKSILRIYLARRMKDLSKDRVLFPLAKKIMIALGIIFGIVSVLSIVLQIFNLFGLSILFVSFFFSKK